MSGGLITEITVFVLAIFVGFEVISKVPTMLHTPLMSGTNAIHGIVLLGGLLVVGAEGADTLTKIAGTVAVAFGTINVVGGFLVTDRMLEMFKGRGERKPKKGTVRRARVLNAASQLPPGPRLHRRLLPRGVGALHPRHQGVEPSEQRPQRQPHRGGRDGRSRSSQRCSTRRSRPTA